MDIPELSIAMSQFDVSTLVGTALTRKVLDDGQENAQQMIENISEMQDPNLGTTLDVKA
ncbi:YjfB family protein [Clostridium sp. Mt-5]|uniref:YjfB family protein n=1 Tax=Clostridium moutaii TaxID=3240932 RepID=A0ABV4BT83_9CLOT